MEVKYRVWIGGVYNVFNNLLDAEIEKIDWEEKGYSNVTIEHI